MGTPRQARQRADIGRMLRRLQRATAELDAALGDEANPLSFDELGLLLAALSRPSLGLSAQLAALVRRVETLTRGEFPRDEQSVLVPGAGMLTRSRPGKTRVWEGPRLALLLAARVADEAVDRATGEVMPLGAVCERVARTLIDCAGLDTKSQSWRSETVRRYGLEPDEFYTDEGGRQSVRFID